MAIVSDIEIRLRADIARLQQDMTAARRTVDSGMSSITEAAGRAKAALLGIGAGFGLQKLSELSDEYSKVTSQLRLATDSTKEYAKAYADVKRIANDSQTDLAATGVLYARIANGTKDLGISQQRVSNIVEATNLALKVSGATSQESASAILQLSQAFGAGALRGEEFNAVNEAAPRLMRAIADGLGLPVGALKNLASEGKITSQVLAQVLPQALGKLREEAAQVQTISGAFTVLKNNVLEFVGTTAQSSGAVTVLTRGIGLLSDNLSALAGIALTVVAVKTGTWLAGMANGAYQSVTANRALAASSVATAEANALAATQASLAANTYLAEARTSTLAAVGAEQLAFTTNTLIPAQARAAAAAEAQSVALLELSAAQRAASLGGTMVSGVLAALGGPIGAIITVLGLAATAWSVYQSRQEEANAKAAENTEQSTIQIIGNLEKQNEKLRERIKLSQQNGMGQIAQGDDEGTARLAALLKQINDMKAKGAAIDVGDQVALITLEGIYGDLLKNVKGNKELKDTLAATGTAEKDLVAVREKLTGVSKDYNVELTKLQTALEKGAITLPTYIEAVKLLAVETFKNSTAGKTFTDSVEAQSAAIKRRAEIQSLLNSRMQEHIAFLKQSGQIDEQAATRKAAAADIKDLNDQIGAQQALLSITKRRQDSQKEQADIIGTIGALRTKVNNREKKEEEELFALEQARYRQAINNTADLIEAAQTESRTQRDATRDQQDELAALGLTGRQLAEVTAARLRDRAAALDRRAEIGIIQEVNDELRQQAEELRKQADIGLTRERVQEQQKFWGSIEQTAHDTFVSIGDGGAGMWKRLRDTGKNLFFEWLYQMTLKKWIINVGASFDGTAATAGISNLVGGGSGSGLAGLYSALSGGMTLAGGLGSGFMGSLAGGLNGAGVGSGLTSAAGLQIGTSIANVVGPTVAGAISSGLGALAAAAPWVAGAVAVFTIAKKAFGMGSKEYSGNSTLTGSIGAGGLNADMIADWTKKGGWFRSDQHGTDRQAVSAELAAGLVSTYQTIKDSTAQYAKVLGINADAIANRSQALNIALGKDDAANQKAITDFFSGVADTVAREVLPDLAQFQQAGETAAQTLQRLAGNFQGVNVVLAAMGTDSQTMFGAVGVASIAARERLLQFAGGLDALASQTAFYTQNILTEADRAKALLQPVADTLAALGFAGLTTTAQYKDAVDGLVKSGKVATEEGAKQFAGLMALAPQFKTVADYLAAQAQAAQEQAQAAADKALQIASARSTMEIQIMELQGDAAGALTAQRDLELAAMDESLRPLQNRIYALQDEKAAADAAAEATAENLRVNEATLRGLVDSSMSALGRAIDAQKARVQSTLQDTLAGLDTNIARVNDTIKRTGDLSKALKGAITAPAGVDSAAPTEVARAAITTALAIAKASGVLPTAESMADALAAVSRDNGDNFATLADYQRATARTNAELEALGGLTDGQLDTATLQLQVLQDQKVAAQAAADAETQRLDGILTTAQAQLDAINGVDNSVLSVVDALAAMQVALVALRAGATAANPGGVNTLSGTTTVEDLYRQVLGREGEAAGIAYWKNVFGDAVDQSEYLAFVKGALPELQGPPTVADTASSSTMSGSSAMSAEQQQINARMEASMSRTAAAVEQLAQQFNQVSAGGNALATESI